MLSFFALSCVFTGLASAASNSSVSYSTSTLVITSFLTQTAPSATTSRSALANATGLEYASSCNQAKLDWVDNFGQTLVSNTSHTTTTSSVSYEYTNSGWIETSGDTEVYTLCDGWPRVNASTTFKTIDTTVPVDTIWSTFVTTTEVYHNVSAPTCTIAPAECSVLSSEYEASESAFQEWWTTRATTSGESAVPSPTEPICGIPTRPPREISNGNPACRYNHATIQLLYWPVETVGNHLCGNNWTTVEATPTIEGQPNTAVAFNTTFTSPTVYMVMSGAYENGPNYETGTAINGILPMPSQGVSSMCAQQGGAFGPPESMDYADFDAPIPASKYRCQPACWTKPAFPQSYTDPTYNITATENLCSTIYDQVYKPALQVPVAEFRSYFAQFPNGIGVDDNGLQCSFEPVSDGIFFDPPSALARAQSAAGPSVPNSPGATTSPESNPQPTPAAPGLTVPTALPQTTDGGDDTAQPTQPNNPSPSDSGDNDDDDTSEPSEPGNGGGDNDNGGSNDSNNNDGGSSGGDADNNSNESPSQPSPTHDIGGIIASVIGAGGSDAADPTPGALSQDSAAGQQDPADPAGQQDSTGPSDQQDPADPSGVGNSGDSSSDDSSNEAAGPNGGASANEGVILTDSSGQSVTAIRSDDNLILPSATIAAGQETSIDGIGAISVGSDGVAQNGQTVPVQTGLASPGDSDADDVYVVDGQTYTAGGSSNVVVAPDVTLTAGGSAATVSGKTYSLGDDDGLVVNGVTATLSEGSSATGTDGLPEQTGNAAFSTTVVGWRFSVAAGLVILGIM